MDNDSSSLDYSADWDTFSFESELNTRKNILREDLKAYKELLGQLYTDNSANIGDSIIKDLEASTDFCNGYLKENENIFSKYTSLMREHKKIKKNLEVLTAKNNSLEKTIKDITEEEAASYKQYQELKLALLKAAEMYTTYFNIDVTTKAFLSDTTYEASIHFKEKNNVGPIKFIVDRVNRKIVDFKSDGILSPKEEEQIMNQYGNLQNLPGLFCVLRDIVLSK